MIFNILTFLKLQKVFQKEIYQAFYHLKNREDWQTL